MSQCQSREGFLFKHACGEAAGNHCAVCKKAICRDHGRHHPDGHICVACLRNQGPANRRSETDRDDDHDHYYDDPYFYSTAYYVGYRSSSYHDRNDFTEGDGAAVLQEGDEGFEHDLEAS